jgi:hypothetical protein
LKSSRVEEFKGLKGDKDLKQLGRRKTSKRQNAETPKRQNAKTPKRQNIKTSKRRNVEIEELRLDPTVSPLRRGGSSTW